MFKKISLFILLILSLFLWACSNNKNISHTWKNENKSKENITNQVQESNIPTKDIKYYIKLDEESKISTEEKEKIQEKVKQVEQDMKKKWIDIEVVAIENYKALYWNKIKRLIQINNLMQKVKNMQDSDNKARILKSLQFKKAKILKEFKKLNISDKEINAILKYTSLPEDKRKEIDKKIDEVSSNIILENGKIVSKKFKQKYEEVKARLTQWISNKQGPIPYEVVVQEMIKEEKMKEWKCDELENEIDRAECRDLQKNR